MLSSFPGSNPGFSASPNPGFPGTSLSSYQQWMDVCLVILHGDFAGGDWKYWLLGPDSHNVISEGTSDTPFDTSSHDLQPMPGPITLGD